MTLKITGTAWQENGPGDNWTFEPDQNQSLVPVTEYRADDCVLQDGKVDEDGYETSYDAVADFVADVATDDWIVKIIEIAS